MTLEDGKTTETFDVALIAANMKGWILTQQKNQDSPDKFNLSRKTREGGRLRLRLDRTAKSVSLNGFDTSIGGKTFTINCLNVTSVDILENSITFHGNVDYLIEFAGAIHEVRFPDADPNSSPITARCYDFMED